MSSSRVPSIHKAGLQVLKAISASIRLQILNLLLEYGSLSYTEILNYLKMDATRDAGRFAYHLKSLLKADLVESDGETKKYRLTDLGRRIIEVTEEIEDQTYKRKRMLVRTSRLSMEEFDRNKIAQSLITEASVPTDLAQKIAREAEKRLQQFKTKYLTAPLIREIVNSILLEKHYEEYRHKLTRLGLPVHEVTRLIGTARPNVEAVHKAAGSAVLEEYTLLNVLPRSISDAHLSGSLNLHNLGSWITKPNEVTHSLPYFLQAHRPKTLEAALDLILNTIRSTATEIIGQQNLDNFNTHLAPYAKDVANEKTKELLRIFIKSLSQTAPIPVTISLELLAEKSGVYSKDAQQLALLLFQTMAEENQTNPLQNPRLVAKIANETLKNSEAETLLHAAHELAASSILVYFANLCPETERNATYTASGLRLADEWQQDWELDTQRTGNLDVVTLNLPRISFDAKGEEAEFTELLNNQLDLATEALEIKYATIKKRMEQGLLPNLTQRTNGDQYFRLENTTRTVALLGLNETVQTLMGKEVTRSGGKTAAVTERVVQYVAAYMGRHSRKPLTRLAVAILPNDIVAARLAKLDVEKYGWGVVKAQGTKEAPRYSTVNTVSLLDRDQLALEERLHPLTSGGHLTLVATENPNPTAEELLTKTRQLATRQIAFFAYDLRFTYCLNCKATSSGHQLKCPSCKATSILSLKHE
jgi:anaerobic ribonucleoside-triphosphate reductase/predicted transcriptional regulator